MKDIQVSGSMFFKTKDHDLETLIIGSDEGRSAIIMLPSLGCHADFCFDESISGLSREHTLYLINHPNHGFSAGSLRVEPLIDSISEVARKLGERHDFVFGLGHSFGSFVLSGLSREYIDGLVLIGMPLNLGDTKIANTFGWIGDLPYPVARIIFQLYDKTRLLLHERYRKSNIPYRASSDNCDAYFGAIKIDQNVFEDLKNLVRDHDKFIAYHNEDVPVSCLIYGELDDRLGYDQEGRMKVFRCLPEHSQLLKLVSGADHNLNINKRTGRIAFLESGVLTNIVKFYRERFN